MPPQLLIIFYRFFGSNQNRTRTELTEPVLSVLVQSGSGSGNIPTVRFSVLHKGVENRTELNFGNTKSDHTLARYLALILKSTYFFIYHSLSHPTDRRGIS